MPMRSRIVLPAAFLFLIASGAAAYQFLPRAKLVASETSHDFGPVTPNQDLAYSFRLARSGFGSLRIVKVVSSCGCLDARLREEGNGWSLDIKMRAEQNLGEKLASVWVKSDELLNNEHEYEIRCEVVSPVTISPSPPDFGNVEADRSSSSRLVLNVVSSEGLGEPEVQIIDRVDPPVVRFVQPIQGTRYSLGFADPTPIGPLTAKIRVSFPSGQPAPMEFPLRGMIIDDIAAFPAEIESIWEHPDQPFVAMTRLRTEGPASGQKFTIDRLYSDLSDPTSLDVGLTRDAIGDQLVVRLKPGPRWARGGICRGVARVRSGDRWVIHIPVNINIGS